MRSFFLLKTVFQQSYFDLNGKNTGLILNHRNTDVLGFLIRVLTRNETWNSFPSISSNKPDNNIFKCKTCLEKVQGIIQFTGRAGGYSCWSEDRISFRFCSYGIQTIVINATTQMQESQVQLSFWRVSLSTDPLSNDTGWIFAAIFFANVPCLAHSEWSSIRLNDLPVLYPNFHSNTLFISELSQIMTGKR